MAFSSEGRLESRQNLNSSLTCYSWVYMRDNLDSYIPTHTLREWWIYCRSSSLNFTITLPMGFPPRLSFTQTDTHPGGHSPWERVWCRSVQTVRRVYAQRNRCQIPIIVWLSYNYRQEYWREISRCLKMVGFMSIAKLERLSCLLAVKLCKAHIIHYYTLYEVWKLP